MKNEEQKMYIFKRWVSIEERIRVMEIIKYAKVGLIYQESYDSHPDLQDYFEPVEQNESQKVEIKGLVTQSGDSSRCWHLRAFKGKRDYFCPDCHMRGEIYIENGKKMFKKWKEL